MELILAVLLIGVAFLLLGLNIFFRGRKFPETEVGRNSNMRKLGIYCTKCEEMKAWKQMQKKKSIKINPSDLQIDPSVFKL